MRRRLQAGDNRSCRSPTGVFASKGFEPCQRTSRTSWRACRPMAPGSSPATSSSTTVAPTPNLNADHTAYPARPTRPECLSSCSLALPCSTQTHHPLATRRARERWRRRACPCSASAASARPFLAAGGPRIGSKSLYCVTPGAAVPPAACDARRGRAPSPRSMANAQRRRTPTTSRAPRRRSPAAPAPPRRRAAPGRG
jgi:hypothetical protein